MFHLSKCLPCCTYPIYSKHLVISFFKHFYYFFRIQFLSFLSPLLPLFFDIIISLNAKESCYTSFRLLLRQSLTLFFSFLSLLKHLHSHTLSKTYTRAQQILHKHTIALSYRSHSSRNTQKSTHLQKYSTTG